MHGEQLAHRQALTHTDHEHNRLKSTSGGVQHLTCRSRGLPRTHLLRVRHRVLHVPPAGTVHVRVRAGADAPPVLVAPVGEVVVAAGVLAARVVGHLVPVVAGFGEQLLGEQVHVRHEVFVGHGVFAAADLRGKLGAVLHDQRVRGNMVRLVGDCGANTALPLVQALPRRTVNQVHGHLQADLFSPGDDLRHVGGRVGAVEYL